MSYRLARFALFVAAMAMLIPPAWAQENVEAVPAEPAAKVPDTPTAKAFTTQFAAWEALLKQIPDLQKKFAEQKTDAEREAVAGEFDKLIEQVEATVPTLRKVALAAFLEHPNADPQVCQFLVAMVQNDLQADNYIAARKLSDTLLEKKCDEKNLYAMAGVAAFCTHDFDRAQTLLTKAAEEQALSRVGQHYLMQVEEYKKLWKEEEALRMKEAAADDLPRVKLETSKGDIVVELFENEAPQTVGNFINLVEKDYYNGLKFHRVLPGFMAQGGDPTGSGAGGPGYSIFCELDKPNHRKHFSGTLSMAHAGKDTGGSQFFLTFVPTPHLNGRHTAFGRVIAGMEVLSELQRIDPGAFQDGPEPDKIVKATVLRKRDHEYVPTKVPENKPNE